MAASQLDSLVIFLNCKVEAYSLLRLAAAYRADDLQNDLCGPADEEVATMRQVHGAGNRAQSQILISAGRLTAMVMIALLQLVMGFHFYRSRALYHWPAGDAVVLVLPFTAAMVAQCIAAWTSRTKHWAASFGITIGIFCLTMLICLNVYGS